MTKWDDSTRSTLLPGSVPVGDTGSVDIDKGSNLGGATQLLDDRARWFHSNGCSDYRHAVQAKSVANLDSESRFILSYGIPMLSEWLLNALKSSRITQAELSRQLSAELGRSVDKAAVNKMTKGIRKIAADELLAIERITATPAPKTFLMDVDNHRPMSEVDRSQIPNATIGERIQARGNLIPVYGQAVGGIDGEFVMNGSRLGEILAPPNLTSSSGAYAVHVSGDSMEPRYYDGEAVFVDPTRRPRQGNFVVAQIQLEEHGPILAFVKRLVSHNSNELILEQFNPPKRLTFPHENVVSVHVAVMSGLA